MKILQAHNFYQLSGGEDTVVASERLLLEENGHSVIPYYKHNNQLKGSFKEKLKLINNTSWSKVAFDEVDALLKEHQPDVCHVHNFLPLISPSIYDACIQNGVPVIQTLHNYRLICANGLFSREGQICEDCLGKSPMGAVKKKCYRDSFVQTYMVADMLQKHNKRDTWASKVDRFICMTTFAKNKFVEHGLPEEKIVVKSNFVADQVVNEKKESYLVYVGRLEKEKGVDLLIKTAASLPIKIKVLGEGCLTSELSQISNIEVMGQRSPKETIECIAKAKALLFPSILYEGMPMTILEAFSVKTPVIATNIGAMKSMIQHQKTGLLFELNSQNAFLDAIKFSLENENKMKEISNFAYEEFSLKYSKRSNYQALITLYQQVCKQKE